MDRELQSLPDDVLIRYLLGQLPADQAAALDERSIVDRSFAERLRGIEHDLADAYVRGELAPAERAQLERTFGKSIAGWEQMQLAEALVLAERRHASAAAVSPSVRRSPWTSRRLVGLAAAAAVVVAFSADYAIRHSPPDTGGVSTVGTIGVQPPAEPVASPAEPKPSAPVVALTLAPPMRTAIEAPVLAIPAGAPEVQLTLRLDPAPFSRYAIELRDAASGRTVWRAADVAAVERADGRVLPVTVPATAFHDGRFVLDVHGTGARGSEIIGNYPLQVAVAIR